ncbi:hypothetical protein SAMN05216203_1843 [Marinobacter daqiaonensis]|uniref:Nitroreductase family protein n=1 Tax=Marinobacter daqiaonensis TaxID=650891 RepID=A0A1I6I5E7_9GAMM|nr:hypothetical protein SAMN05216203_1843 [Marinobacter daqiaonensis]
MTYSDTVSEIWRHHDLGIQPQDYGGLIRYATLAASSHNTQPWIFRAEPGRIWILPDLSRRCPAVDPGCRPDLIVRIGRGPEMPRSLRRPVEEVLRWV